MNEEERKAIEKFIKKCNNFDESVEIKGVSVGEEYRTLETVCKALDLVEKLQKENEELKEINEELSENKLLQDIEIKKNLISKQKVKDKIEELQKEYNKLDKQVDEYIKSVEKNVSTYYENKERTLIKQALSYFIDTLQELIEEREEKNHE